MVKVVLFLGVVLGVVGGDDIALNDIGKPRNDSHFVFIPDSEFLFDRAQQGVKGQEKHLSRQFRFAEHLFSAHLGNVDLIQINQQIQICIYL